MTMTEILKGTFLRHTTRVLFSMFFRDVKIYYGSLFCF